MSVADAKALCRMLELHGDRVAAYNAWHEAFRVYLLDEQGGIHHHMPFAMAHSNGRASLRRLRAQDN